jgi:hypothetical protein
VTASPSTANHLADLDARFDVHVDALRARAAEAQAALDRAIVALAASLHR